MRDIVREALERIRAVWPSLPVTAHTVDAYAEAVAGFDADVVMAGARLLLQRHEGVAAPKPAQLRQACGEARRYRQAQLGAPATGVDASAPSYCAECRTGDLWDAPGRDGLSRRVPLHRANCSRWSRSQPAARDVRILCTGDEHPATPEQVALGVAMVRLGLDGYATVPAYESMLTSYAQGYRWTLQGVTEHLQRAGADLRPWRHALDASRIGRELLSDGARRAA